MSYYEFKRVLMIPSISDFSIKYARFSNDIRPDKFDELFSELIKPEAISMMLTATDMNLNLPGMSGVASMMARKFFNDFYERGLWDQAKQFAGAVICHIHELNGYRKVKHNGGEVKKAVGYPTPVKQAKVFTNAQLYEKAV